MKLLENVHKFGKITDNSNSFYEHGHVAKFYNLDDDDDNLGLRDFIIWSFFESMIC